MVAKPGKARPAPAVASMDLSATAITGGCPAMMEPDVGLA